MKLNSYSQAHETQVGHTRGAPESPGYPVDAEGKASFFCYCCGEHYRATPCNMCGDITCYRCGQWAYKCRTPGNRWCRLAHLPRGECPHPLAEVEHQLIEQLPLEEVE